MPRDMTMPQLGMAQDAGKIVAWMKAPGDPVAKGEPLFEVETDKATMEVEAQADGFLAAVTASGGDDVKVGAVIARIVDSADEVENAGANATGPEPEPDTDASADTDAPPDTSNDLPDGHRVTMPQLGMAQDSGLLVSWGKAPGDEVAKGDVLFEVETDKSTMEVEADRDGYLAATLAQAGEEVPTGSPVAILSVEKPENTAARSVAETPKADASPDASDPQPEEATDGPDTQSFAAAPTAQGGRILASPKARRLAREQGLDLARLVEAGHPQPYHVRDLETLRDLPEADAGTQAGAAPVTGAAQASLRLVAETQADGLPEFAKWAGEVQGLTDGDAILAGLVFSTLPVRGAVTVERFGTARTFAPPPGDGLRDIAETDTAPVLILRDLRGSPLRTVAMGAEEAPVLTVTTLGAGLSVTLEAAPQQLDPGAAIQLITDFASRMEQPLRLLL